MQQAAIDPAGRELPETFLKLFAGLLEELSSRPPWFRKRAVVQGITALYVYSGYLFASVGLLGLWPRSVACFHWASGAVIAFTLVSSVVGIAATRDKAAFRRVPPPLPPRTMSA